MAMASAEMPYLHWQVLLHLGLQNFFATSTRDIHFVFTKVCKNQSLDMRVIFTVIGISIVMIFYEKSVICALIVLGTEVIK
jgi:hypothetical protein